VHFDRTRLRDLLTVLHPDGPDVIAILLSKGQGRRLEQLVSIGYAEAVPVGKVTARFEFTEDGGGLGKGGTGTVLINGEKVAVGRIDQTQGMALSAGEGADVGMDSETPVSDDYKANDNRFTGTSRKIVLEVGPLQLSAADREKIHRGLSERKAAE
jgi:hypothetical protein